MNFLRLIVFGSVFVVAAGASRATDFERALGLARRTENKVFRTPHEIHWLPEHGQFWYWVQTGAHSQEYVLVDAETDA